MILYLQNPVAEKVVVHQTLEKQGAWCQMINVEFTLTIQQKGLLLPKQ